jgi:beta-galactosidase
MFHGGTSFGFMNGANWDHTNNEPDVTSYDSPVSESGGLTKKYFAFREVIAKYRPGVQIPDPPAPLPVIEVPEFQLTESAPLWKNLPKPVVADHPRSMENISQSYGYILYRTNIKQAETGELEIHELRSYARIFVNGKPNGKLDRRQKQSHLRIAAEAGSTLDILVEGTGRINFTTELRKERQGLNGTVTLAGKELSDWQVFPLPMDDPSKLQFSNLNANASTGPAFYRGRFDLADTGDTLLDTRGWGKGAAWINGHALGRFWNLGPQQTLYVPVPWLRKGANEVLVFTQDKPKVPQMRGLRVPILDELERNSDRLEPRRRLGTHRAFGVLRGLWG